MKKLFFYTGIFCLTLTACTTPSAETPSVNPEVELLKKENERLKAELVEQDSAVSQSFRLLNEIEDNLSLITQKEKLITMSRTSGPELPNDQKDRIVNDIQLINSLMEQNRNKIASLQERLKQAGIAADDFNKRIESLTAKVNEQEALITSLREDLARYDIAMDELTATLNEAVATVEEKEAELNTAYYVIGSSRELRDQGVITREGGFIGMGKIKKLREDFNRNYFTQIDITRIKEIHLGGSKIEILTTHPKDSYKITGSDKVQEKLQILDIQAFWSISKYLVVVVD